MTLTSLAEDRVVYYPTLTLRLFSHDKLTKKGEKHNLKLLVITLSKGGQCNLTKGAHDLKHLQINRSSKG